MKKSVILLFFCVGTVFGQHPKNLHVPFYKLNLPGNGFQQSRMASIKDPNAFGYLDVGNKMLSTNSTYWLPTKEIHYNYSSSNWNLTDSTRFKYHLTPGVMAGKINYDYFYDLTTSDVIKDTFTYNSSGYEILNRQILWGLPSYTITSETHTSYYPSWNKKGELFKWYQLDANNCLPGGPVNKLLNNSLDTFIYNSSNHLIVNLSKYYDLSTCNWKNNFVDSFIRNSNNLIIRENTYLATSPSYTWTPNTRFIFTYNTHDTIKEVLYMNYNTTSSKFDTLGKYKNIVFHYYYKYDLNACVIKKYEFYNYSSGTFTPSFMQEYVYDSYNNITKSLQKSWNGTSYNDTVFGYFRTIYYKPSTTIGEIDSIVEKMKMMPNPIKLTDKYLYTGIQVTGINDLINLKEAFRLYPTPASDIVYVIPQSGFAINEINILDISGKLLKTIKYSNISTKISIPLIDLPSGYYVLKITNQDGKCYHGKILKN